LDSVLKKQTVQKFDIRRDGFPIETACNPHFKLKVTNFVCIQCADKERFKMWLKQSLAWNAISLLTNLSLLWLMT